MYVFVLTVHVILCLLLVLVILMQPGKGADISSAFGGGASSQMFGASGPGNILTRSTGTFAALFFVTSVALTFLSEDRAGIGGSAADEAADMGDEERGSGFLPTVEDQKAPEGATPPPEGATPAPGSAAPAPEGVVPAPQGAPTPAPSP